MEQLENEFSLNLTKNIEMRYGENPHQNAAYFVEAGNSGVHNFFTEGKLHGKELSYNNIADISGALRILAEYYGSDEWKQDFADDEAGRLPKDLKRGVLSEDGLWNLLYS